MKKAAQTTSDLFLAFFKAIFCREGKRPLPEKTFSEILDTPCLSLNVFKKEIKQVTQSTSPHLTLGEYLSNLLMNQLNTFHVAALGRRTVVSSLSCLFAVSTTSKLTAVETGFLESVIEDIKDIHVKLNLASLQMNKDDNQNKRVWCRALLHLCFLCHFPLPCHLPVFHSDLHFFFFSFLSMSIVSPLFFFLI